MSIPYLGRASVGAIIEVRSWRRELAADARLARKGILEGQTRLFQWVVTEVGTAVAPLGSGKPWYTRTCCKTEGRRRRDTIS